MIQELSALAFIERNENVVLVGPSGVGKTHCENGISVVCATETMSGCALSDRDDPKTHWRVT